MKLFKSLLVAPATLGLLAPMSVTANEINLNDVSNYYSSEEVESIGDFNPAKEIAVTNSRVDGLEARLNNFEAGSFSSTTTASFSADFAIGAVEGKGVGAPVGAYPQTDGDETLQAVYGFQIDLNTSFTGEDSLDISLDAGNGLAADLTASPAIPPTPLAEFDLNQTADKLTVDGVSYTFPIGDSMTAFVGDNSDGSALFTTACTYGGPSNTLDDCGNVTAGITGGGVAAGASYDFDNGFTVAAGYQGTETGLGTEENDDSYAINGAYTTDSYGVSLTYATIETGTDEDTYTAVNGYYSPEGFPSISVGYEIGEDGSETNKAIDEFTSFFIGLQFDEVGPGTFGVAMGTKTPTQEASDEEYMYEAYYTYDVSDGMSITPLVYVKEKTTAGVPDDTGVMVKTSFSF